MIENELTQKIIGLAMQVHMALGPGLLESVYKECLYYNIVQAGLNVEREKPIPLIYQEVKLSCGYRIDILVEHSLVVEVKSVEFINDIHHAQTLTYMKIGQYPLGLLLNFNVIKLKDGIKRLINSPKV